jgi:Transposase DDE domain
MSLVEMFVAVDDYCQAYERGEARQVLGERQGKRGRKCGLVASEIITIVLCFHQSKYRRFKDYYLEKVEQAEQEWKGAFPGLVSYNRFVELMPRVVLPLWGFLLSRMGKGRGIAFADSTTLSVCHPKRIKRHKVFAGVAQRGKSSMGWFFGFKLHLIVDECGERLAFRLTPGNVNDRQPLPQMTLGLSGKRFADTGYLSQPLFDSLFQQGLQLVTPLRKNLSNRLIPLHDKLWLRKPAIIETINDQLKNIQQVDHSRHRSHPNFLVNLLAGLLAYTFQSKKPSLSLSKKQPSDLHRTPRLLAA